MEKKRKQEDKRNRRVERKAEAALPPDEIDSEIDSEVDDDGVGLSDESEVASRDSAIDGV